MMTKDKLRQLSGDERLGQMRESEYLGAEDIDDGTEPILTIAGLWYGSVTLQRGKENKDVLSFAEERVPGIYQVRPLIVREIWNEPIWAQRRIRKVNDSRLLRALQDAAAQRATSVLNLLSKLITYARKKILKGVDSYYEWKKLH